MDEMNLDSLDFEEFEDFDDGEGDMYGFDDADDADDDDFDGEDDLFGEFDAEGRRSRSRSRSRRARARMRASRRRRQLAMRQRGTRPRSRPRTPSGKIASNRAQIKKVGLESAVKADVLAGGLKFQNRRIGGTENAISAGKVIDEIRAQFPQLSNNKFIKTGLPLAPLLFLKPPKKDGVQGLAMDPRVWGPVIAAGAALFQEFRGSNSEPREVVFNVGNLQLAQKTSFPLTAEVKDKNGRILDGRSISYDSLNSIIADVDKATGVLTTKTKDGVATITGTDAATGKIGTVTVTVGTGVATA